MYAVLIWYGIFLLLVLTMNCPFFWRILALIMCAFCSIIIFVKVCVEVRGVFSGFSDETMEFFLGIRFDNSKSFMDAHRQQYYDYVRGPFYALIDDLAQTALSVDPDMEVRPHKCLSRLNRDIRFSNDKSPYRDHLWFCFRKAGADKTTVPNYWFEMGPDSMNWGLGTWGENRPMMDVMRRKMAAKPRDFVRLYDMLSRNGFVMGGNCFKKLDVPVEIPDKLQNWYKHREIYLERPDAQMAWAFSADLTDRIRQDYLCLRPMYDLLKGCMEQAMEEME